MLIIRLFKILRNKKPRLNHNVRVKSGLILGYELIRTLVTLVCFSNKGLILGKKRGLILGYDIWSQKGHKTWKLNI
jgi:hypothetical protein